MPVMRWEGDGRRARLRREGGREVDRGGGQDCVLLESVLDDRSLSGQHAQVMLHGMRLGPSVQFADDEFLLHMHNIHVLVFCFVHANKTKRIHQGASTVIAWVVWGREGESESESDRQTRREKGNNIHVK